MQFVLEAAHLACKPGAGWTAPEGLVGGCLICLQPLSTSPLSTFLSQLASVHSFHRYYSLLFHSHSKSLFSRKHAHYRHKSSSLLTLRSPFAAQHILLKNHNHIRLNIKMRFSIAAIQIAALAGLASAQGCKQQPTGALAGNPIGAPGLNEQVQVGTPFTITWNVCI